MEFKALQIAEAAIESSKKNQVIHLQHQLSN
jgi:hypothetical protein